jgi:UDP-N-acetylglucosamine--N-acetylmuramyl-(pentapeptide) pyrophosphoryl-undecaprenol N-acetylglucosamine transferase
MENAYAAADLVISRSGAMAVAELCIVKKPVIFVPFPHAAEDHQTVNAMNLVNEQAAMIVKDSAARENLVPAAISLAADADRRRYLAGHISRLAIQDADDVVAKDMLETLSKLK